MKRKAINTLYNTIRIQMFTVCTTPPPAKKPGVVQRLKPAKSNIYARRVAGLFFCLASNTVQGFYFARRRISYTQAFTAAFLPSMQNYTATTLKLFTGLYSGVSCDCTRSTATDTRSTKADIPPPRRTLYSSAQPPIIIRYIRVRRCAPVVDPYQAVQHNTDHASPAGQCIRLASCAGSARRLAIWHRSAARAWRAGGKSSGRNHWRLPPHLFSGFRPIANRGQQ